MHNEVVLAALDERLGALLEPLLGSLGREDRRRWACLYVAGVPPEVAYRSKNTLALELFEEALAVPFPQAPTGSGASTREREVLLVA